MGYIFVARRMIVVGDDRYYTSIARTITRYNSLSIRDAYVSEAVSVFVRTFCMALYSAVLVTVIAAALCGDAYAGIMDLGGFPNSFAERIAAVANGSVADAHQVTTPRRTPIWCHGGEQVGIIRGILSVHTGTVNFMKRVGEVILSITRDVPRGYSSAMYRYGVSFNSGTTQHRQISTLKERLTPMCHMYYRS